MRVIKGKKALVTGAASGIGRAISESLAREGADLFLLDRDESGLERLARDLHSEPIEVVTRRCDVGRRRQLVEAVDELTARWGRLDILVNNAGVAYYGPTVEMTEDQWDWLMSINVEAPIHLTRMLLPTLLDQPEAHVVNVASMYGLFPGRRLAAYTTSKFALVGFSESLRMEYGRAGLGVTAVCPGFVTTPFFSATVSGRPGGDVPTPPRWIRTTPESVARRVVRAIRRDRRMIVLTPLAHLLYGIRRTFPGLPDRLYRFGRRKAMRRKAMRRKAATPDLGKNDDSSVRRKSA